MIKPFFRSKSCAAKSLFAAMEALKANGGSLVRKFVPLYIAVLCCSFCGSCSKYYGDDYFNFSQVGGGWVFENVDMDGETLKIQSDDETGDAEYWPESSIDDDPLWTAKISWAVAKYQPSRHILFVRVDENDTGNKRSCVIIGEKDVVKKCFTIRQVK